MRRQKIVIVGNPNVGKSMLFNKLDDIYSVVSNYPHTTVELTRSHIDIGGEQHDLIDCPGIDSFSYASEAEQVTLDVIINEKPDIIIQCIDSTNLERSVLLTSQLAELKVPLVLSLNIMDRSFSKGTWLDSDLLELQLGAPVVETIATEGKGMEDLEKRLEEILRSGARKVQGPIYGNMIEESLLSLENCFSSASAPSRAILILLLEGEKRIELWVEKEYGKDILKKVRDRVEKINRRIPYNISNLIFQNRQDWAEKIVENIIRQSKINIGNLPAKLGHFTRHPVWGWPILGTIVYITYLLVGRLAAGTITPLIADGFFRPIIDFAVLKLGPGFLADILLGDYGILSMGLADALSTALPILFIFFLILNILEDTGYLTNLCILTCRITGKLGLGGKAMLPLMLGFGCKTMATLTSKILDSKRERYITVFLIAFAIPCAPQLGLIMGILGSFSFSAFAIVFGVLALAEVTAGIILNKIIDKEPTSDFIMEVPPITMPGVKNIFTKLYYRMVWFLKEAPPLFMLGALLLFVLDLTGGLILLKHALAPIVVSFLSLPEETIEALLLGIVKHEAGAVLLINMTNRNLLSLSQVIVSLIVITAIGPCFANMMAIIKELKLKKALVLRIVILILAILLGGAVNWIIRYTGMF